MKYTTWDFAPKNDFSRKLTWTVERSKEDPPPVWARGELGLDFDGRRSGSPLGPVEPFGPLEPIGPGDEETVELFDPDPPHDASASAASASAASDSTRPLRMPAILAARSKRPIVLHMDVGIAGGHGKIARRLARLLGKVSRDDVAAVLEALLHEPRSAHRIFYVNAGDDPINRALEAALSR
jgi:hypothetical protein